MNESAFTADSARIVNPPLLTFEQVAELLNLGRTKTYELINGNRIKSVKLGRRPRSPSTPRN